MLKPEYRVQDVIDYSGLEHDGVFLEGAGAMVLDHIARVAYTATSNRAGAVALGRFCTHFNFEPMALASADAEGRAVYHTNVLMGVATALELSGEGGRLLALSERAAASLTAAQRQLIESSARLVPLAVLTIEMAGGSVRCMLAGIHLARR